MGLLKKIGQGIKKIGKKIGSAIDNTAKKLATSSNVLLSGIGSVVDVIIPDKEVQAMADAAKRDGTTKVAEVEKTVQKAAAAKGVTDVTTINAVVHETAKAIAEETATSVDDKEATVKMSLAEKVQAFCKKYAKWLIGGGAALVVALVAWLTTRKGGKKRFRR